MDEKLYQTMGVTGAGNIAIGVIMVVVGVAAGVIAIVSGAKLLSDRKHLTF